MHIWHFIYNSFFAFYIQIIFSSKNLYVWCYIYVLSRYLIFTFPTWIFTFSISTLKRFCSSVIHNAIAGFLFFLFLLGSFRCISGLHILQFLSIPVYQYHTVLMPLFFFLKWDFLFNFFLKSLTILDFLALYISLKYNLSNFMQTCVHRP